MVDRSMREGVNLDGVQTGEPNRSTLFSAGNLEPGDFK